MATTLVLLNFLASSEVKVRLDEVPPRKRSQPGAPLAATVAGELRRGPAAAESAAPPIREAARARSGDTSSGAKLKKYSFKNGNKLEPEDFPLHSPYLHVPLDKSQARGRQEERKF